MPETPEIDPDLLPYLTPEEPAPEPAPQTREAPSGLMDALRGVTTPEVQPKPSVAAQGGRITSPYGQRMHPIDKVQKMHTGVDIDGNRGDPVRAARGGKVIKVKRSNRGWGNHVVVDHGGGITSMYAHMDNLDVNVGDEVSEGQVLGGIGDSGKTTGTHLHFEVRKDGKHVDPSEYMAPPEKSRPPIDKEFASQLGLTRIAGNEVSTVFGAEGDAPAESLVLRQGQKPGGGWGMDPGLMEERLTYWGIEAEMRKRGVSDFYNELPEAVQDSIIRVAKDRARNEVAGIIGSSDQRKNVFIDPDPDQTVQDIINGQTALGWLAGPGLASKAFDVAQYASEDVPVLEDVVDSLDTAHGYVKRAMAPFYAMMVRGGKSVQPQGDTPVVGVEKESLLSWFFRAGLWSVVGSVALDDSLETDSKGFFGAPAERIQKYWGTEEHIKNLYSEGYDIVSETRNIGEMYAEMTPWVDSDLAKKIAGFGGMVGLIVVEPDLTLGLLKVGKVLKAGKIFSASNLVVDTVMAPTLRNAIDALDAGEDIASVNAKIAGDLPRESLRHAINVDFDARLLAGGARLAEQMAGETTSNLPRMISGLEDTLAKSRDLLAGQQKAASDLAAESVSAKRWQTATLDLGQDEVTITQAMLKHLRMEARLADGVRYSAAARGLGPEAFLNRYSVNRLTGLLQAARRVGNQLKRTKKAIDDLPPGWDGYMPLVRRSRELTASLRHIESEISAGRIADSYRQVRDIRKASQIKLRDLLAETYGSAAPTFLQRLSGRTMASSLENLASTTRPFTGGYKLVLRAAESAHLSAVSRLPNADKTARALGAEAGDKLTRAQNAMESVRATEDSIRAAEAGLETTARAREIYREVLQDALDSTVRVSEAIRTGKLSEGEQVLRYQASVIGKLVPDEAALKSLPGDIVTRWSEGVTATYGAERVSAVMAKEAGSLMEALGKPSNVVNRLLNIERVLAKTPGATSDATIRAALTDIVERQIPWGKVSMANMLAWSMTAGNRIAKLVNPLMARGLGNATKPIQNLVRRAHERFATASVHAGYVLREWGPQGLFEFLTSNKRFTVGGSMVSFNQDALLPYQKWFEYLKSLQKLGPEAFTSDVGVKAVSRAWLTPGREGVKGAASAGNQLYRWVRDTESADDLLALVLDQNGTLRRVFQKFYGGAEPSDLVAARFAYQGIMFGAVQYDAVQDLARIGGEISAEAAQGLNYIVGREIAPNAPAVTAKGLADARNVIEKYGLAMTEKIRGGTAKANLPLGAENLVEFQRVANDLVEITMESGGGVVVPRHIWDALQSIPKGLAKELEQWHPGMGTPERALNKWLATWRYSVVNGFFFPRIAHYGTTFLGDLPQQIAVLGWLPAARITGGNLLQYIPFVGRDLSNMIADSRMGRTLSAMTNPLMNRLMQGDETLTFMTADGPRTAAQMLEEGRSVGALDSISTDDLIDLMKRTPKGGILEEPWRALTEPSWLVKRSGEYMEHMQHRIRMQIFAEARVGKLGQAPMTVDEAGKLMRDTMLDWRLGVTPIERATFNQVAAFWTYKRQALQQMGTIFTSSLTKPESQSLLSYMVSNPVSRIRKMGAILNGIPETFYWTDPEMTLDDDAQVYEWARRRNLWYRNVEPHLLTYRLDPGRVAWNSELTGRPVTYEQLYLPGITTLDAVYQYQLMANFAMAGTLQAMNALGIPTGNTTDDWDRIWSESMRELTDSFNPGFDEVFRRILGGEEIRSSRGVSVNRNMALALHRLGWEQFVETYRDKDGRVRYVADSNALVVLGRILGQLPQTENLLSTYAIVDNPGYTSSVTAGLAESFARLSGLVRLGQMDPIQQREWEIRNEDREFKEALRSAKARAAMR